VQVRFYDTLVFPDLSREDENFFQAWPQLWLGRILASLHSPFARTMNLDSDVYVCDGFEDLFDRVDEHHVFAAGLATAK
jgi:hypothetical protein